MRESSKNRKKQKIARRRERVIICAIVLIVVVALGFLTYSLNLELKQKQEAAALLEEEIAEEEARKLQLENEEKLMQSNEFFEQIARERLGLVFPDETVIKTQE